MRPDLRKVLTETDALLVLILVFDCSGRNRADIEFFFEDRRIVLRMCDRGLTLNYNAGVHIRDPFNVLSKSRLTLISLVVRW